MTVTGLVTALGIGLVIGLLGRMAFPDRRDLPAWLPLTVGAVTALLGSILARLAGLGADGSVLLRLLAQIGTAVVGVGLVVGTAHAIDRRAPGADRPPAGPTGGTR